MRYLLNLDALGRLNMERIYFDDRHDAGRKLAEQLESYRQLNPVVLALPRGGVPVGFELAKALHSQLDILLVRKIGAPNQPELAAAALVDGDKPILVRNDDVISLLAIGEGYLREAQIKALAEIERRRMLYVGDRPAPRFEDRTVILVDDGIATGASMKAALMAVRRRNPTRLVLAVPVAAGEAFKALSRLADDAIVLQTPDPFRAVGASYLRFPQIEDEEVIALLKASSTAVP